ncbi:MAG: DUF2971 domain-containing protein [Planctomycetota bacterium]
MEKPALADPLWRYMDFTKFVAMLVKGGMYLTRVDQLGDVYEGYVPKSPTAHYGGFFGEEWLKRDRKLREESRELRKQFYVNCWHGNDKQSDAMWKLYVKGNEGVAIRTTCRNLQAALEDAEEELWIYKVMYADYEDEPIHDGSMLRACLAKRDAFEHEKEVRVVFRNTEPSRSQRKKGKSNRGFYVKCNMSTLIECVYIAPTVYPWFEPIISDVLDKYGIDVEVIQSGLNSKPQ